MNKIICLFGMVDSGKTTVGKILADSIKGSVFIDAHDFRDFCGNTDFSESGRIENIKKLSSLLGILGGNHTIILAFNIPTKELRDILAEKSDVKFVHCQCPFEDMQARDDKGLWERVISDDTVKLPGVNLPFDADGADIVVDTSDNKTLTPYGNASRCAQIIIKHLDQSQE